LFKLVERGHAQLPVNLQDLVRAQTRDAQHRQDALWDVLAHGLKRRVRPGAVELLDNVSDGFAYARNLTEAILRYEAHYESQPQRSLTQWIKSPVPAVRRRQGAGRLRWVRAGRLSARECDAVEICDVMAGMLHADQRVGWNRDQHLA
jgi:hypothetical protein